MLPSGIDVTASADAALLFSDIEVQVPVEPVAADKHIDALNRSISDPQKSTEEDQNQLIQTLQLIIGKMENKKMRDT